MVDVCTYLHHRIGLATMLRGHDTFSDAAAADDDDSEWLIINAASFFTLSVSSLQVCDSLQILYNSTFFSWSHYFL